MRTADASLVEELRRTAGADAVAAAGDPRWHVHGLAPRAVVMPETPGAAAELLARASSEGWRVELAGAGTWLDHGSAPADAPDIVLSTVRMNARIETEPADLVVGVDAGVALGTLRDRLAADAQELPLDPPAAPAATLGGVISLASAGPLRGASGTPRDHVLGLTMVTGDGRVLSFGGRVVKNVAGFDIVRLITGSRGTLGLIASAWLRLRALPAADRTLALAGARDELLEVIAGLGNTAPAAAELLAPATAAKVTGAADWTLLLRLRGGRAEVADAAARIGGLIGGTQLTDLDDDVWPRLAALEAAAAPVFRARRLRAELAATLALCEQFIARSGNDLQDWHVSAHALDGIVRVWPARPMEAYGLAAAGAELRAELESADGSLLVESAPAALRDLLPARGAPDPVTARLEAELKRVFDPAGILGRRETAA